MPEHWQWPRSMVTRVVDGDSFMALVTRQLTIEIPAQDLGFHGQVGPTTLTLPVRFPVKLRLNRINAKPATTADGKRATAMAIALLTLTLVDIETVGPYKYGDEWMAEVTLDDARNVSDALVKAGMAVYWDGTGPRPGG